VKPLFPIAILPLVLLCACGKKTDATRANFEEGLRAYLERRGDLCIGKPAWPIDVSPGDVAKGTRDALQMPVFERLGLVRSGDVTVDVATDDGTIPVEVRRYELTEAGLRDYRSHEIGVNTAGEKVAAGDFCVARVSLSRVVRWEFPQGAPPGDRPRAVVSYTYEVAADPWTRDPEVQRVLPAVAHVVAGARSAELKEPFTLTADGWVADDLLPGDVRYVSNRPAAPGNP
jgi:hypothetical protein